MSRAWSGCSSTRRRRATSTCPTDVETGDLDSARLFARWLSAILAAEGEEIVTEEKDGAVVVRMEGWKLARELQLADPLAGFDAWNELWLGAAGAHGPLPEGRDQPQLRRQGLAGGLADRAEIACGEQTAGNPFADFVESDPACFVMLMTEGNRALGL